MTAIVVKPPVARKESVPTRLHGHTLEDDYRWMREKDSAEVTAYLEAENAYTAAAMEGTEELQARLYKEMLSHIKETDEACLIWIMGGSTTSGRWRGASIQFMRGRRLWTAGLDESQPEQVLLDVNVLAEGQPFMAVGGMSVTPDGWLLAYSTDNTGFRQYTLRFQRSEDRRGAGGEMMRAGGVVWAADGRTLVLYDRGRGYEAA